MRLSRALVAAFLLVVAMAAQLGTSPQQGSNPLSEQDLVNAQYRADYERILRAAKP